MNLRGLLLPSAALLFLAVAVGGCGLFGGRSEPKPVTTATYRPFSADYRGVSLTRTSQHFDDQGTETRFGLRYFVHTNVAADSGSLTVAFSLDSIFLEENASAGISSAQVDSARGARFKATLAPTGRLTDFRNPTQSGSLARELADRLLETFFPAIPYKGAEAGATWVDTVHTEIAVNGMENDVRLVNQHAATAWRLKAGERALHIETTSVYTFTGSGSQAGRSFTIEGSGRRHIDRFISEEGRYLGLVSADTSDAEALIEDLDMVIPIHQTRVDTVSIVR